MKKIVYVIVVLAILLGLAAFFKNYQAEPLVVEENEVVSENPADKSAVVVEEDIVVVDEEPAGEVVGEAVEVVEENPDETSDEGETVVEE